MLTVPPGVDLSGANPLIVFYAQQSGRLTDPYSVEFQVFSVNSDGVQTQIFPATEGDRETVNLEDYPAGDRIGLGRFAAEFTTSTTLGQYLIRWFWTWEDGGNEQSADQRFEVANIIGTIPIYGSIQSLRNDLCVSGTDLQLMLALGVASRLIDKITGRRFGAYYATQRHDGNGSRAQLLWEPIIGVESVAFETEPTDSPGSLTADPANFRVYNRHLQGLTFPDDRNDPKIEFVHSHDLLGISTEARFAPVHGISLTSLVFPYGVQNVEIIGVFGYTEPDGTPWGSVPLLITHAAKKIAARNIDGMSDDDCASAANDRWRVIEEKTRDQSVKFAAPRKFGEWTGDPEIDQILLMHMREPALGSA